MSSPEAPTTPSLHEITTTTKSSLSNSLQYLTFHLSVHELNIIFLYNRSHISTRTHPKSPPPSVDTPVHTDIPANNHSIIDTIPMSPTLENIDTSDLTNLIKELTNTFRNLFMKHEDLLDLCTTTEDLFIIFKDKSTSRAKSTPSQPAENNVDQEKNIEMMSYFEDTEREIARMREVLMVCWGRLQEIKRAWEERIGEEIYLDEKEED